MISFDSSTISIVLSVENSPVERKTKKRRSRPISTEGQRRKAKMRRRNVGNFCHSSIPSSCFQVEIGDDSSGSVPKRRTSRNAKEKTLEQLCEELSIEDVEITYSSDDFENWTVQKLFNQYVEPLIVEKNPNAPKEHIVQILDAKWKEFAIMNPYIPKGEEGECSTRCLQQIRPIPCAHFLCRSFELSWTINCWQKRSAFIESTALTSALPPNVSMFFWFLFVLASNVP